MKTRLLMLLLIVAVMAGSVIDYISFVQTYAEEKTIKIEGKLVQFNFRNPHSFVQIEVKQENGMVDRWSVEWGGAGQLGAQGLSRDTLRPGDFVVITGHPGRNNEDHRL